MATGDWGLGPEMGALAGALGVLVKVCVGLGAAWMGAHPTQTC